MLTRNAFFLTVAALTLVSAYSATPEPQPLASDEWPRQVTIDNQTFSLYQPQVESWKDNQIQERMAVEIQKPHSAQSTFGVAWLSARTEVDKSSRVVNLEDLKVTKLDFPSERDQEAFLTGTLQKKVPEVLHSISLDRLDASLSIAKIEAQRNPPPLKNDPPRIIYSTTPSILVLIDGKPVLRPSGAPGLLRIINTRALLLLSTLTGKSYFYLGDRWLVSDSIKSPWGPWKTLQSPSPQLLSSLNLAKKSALDQNQVDLLNDPATLAELKKGALPKISISTEPTELLSTSGSPQFEPIPNTQLLVVDNTASNIFLNTVDQDYYVLISGRWYHSHALEGSWTYVPPRSLPKDFAKIPENHPKGDVLASVPGTSQAGEAAISNSIPQTATVDRKAAALDVHYDGAPDFIPIAGTPLKSAQNSSLPVIEVDPHTFYSVQNAVWFVASSPSGPWVVATSVPPVIYTIPPTSALYYVTFVTIYGSTPNYVYFGYLPGYLGSYITPDGVVVYGTGYAYPPWIGHVWFGPPATFGFGVAWGYGFGWSFHVGYFAGYFGGTPYSPWWGPWRFAAANRFYYGAPLVYQNVTIHQINVNHMNVYRNWGPRVVRSEWVHHNPLPGYSPARVGEQGLRPSYRYSSPRQGAATQAAPARPNNLYTDRKGKVFRQEGKTWQQYSARGWQSPGRTAPRELEQEKAARQVGQARSNYFRNGGGAAAPTAPPRRAGRVGQGPGRRRR